MKKELVFALIGFAAVGCNGSPDSTQAADVSSITQVNQAAAPADEPVVVADVPALPAELPEVVASPVPTPTPVTLSYKKLIKTVAPQTGWVTKTYTATGSCGVYRGNTFCWDDGVKVLQWTVNTNGGYTYGPFGYTYFKHGIDAYGHIDYCEGSCESDYFVSPVLVDRYIESQFLGNTAAEVLAAGVGAQLNCTLTGDHLDCGQFAVDLDPAVQ